VIIALGAHPGSWFARSASGFEQQGLGISLFVRHRNAHRDLDQLVGDLV
jgi:hypothetical protein